MRKFQGLLVETTFALVFLIFAVNVFLKRGVIESFLFSLALGIGLTPQLLPMIISVTLAKGARDLAKKKVIIKKSSSLENFGSMNVLCCDKTGTLTTGEMTLHSFYDLERRLCPKALELAAVTSFLHAGYDNPLDQAIKKKVGGIDSSWKKLDEIPFDYERRRVTLLAQKENESFLIVKGSFSEVVQRCSFAKNLDGQKVPIDTCIDKLELLLEEFSEKNSKILAVAYKNLSDKTSFLEEDESDLIFSGLLEFYDPLKINIAEEIAALKALGVDLKIISGDNEHIVRHISLELNLNHSSVVKGIDLENLEDLALISLVKEKSLFAEVSPLDKLRIVEALQKGGLVVGFLGDGLNDSAAMKKADVSISVQNATNVAREAADFILLKSSLKVLAEGVEVGRTIFANTLKYIFIATSANFGNMFSMALSSIFLPFLPLLPKQVLLTNLFTDLPEFAISTDQVDAKWKNTPQNWDLSFIKRFMLVFGLISSIFDLTTFVILRSITSSIEAFRTGWFIESVMSASLVLLVIRTERPSFRSRPSSYLFVSVIAVNVLTLMTPLTPLGKLFGLVPLEPTVFFAIFLVIFAYMVTAEIAKKSFYKNQ
jgi:Mg2+-importing ATPase